MLTRRRSAWSLSLVLVAVAVLFVGDAPAGAQSPPTVTRTDTDGTTVQVREGKYYKVVAKVTGEKRAESPGHVREGELIEIIVALGANPGSIGFSCTTHAGTATAPGDYVGGTFPMANAVFKATGTHYGVSSYPIVTKLDSDVPGENIWEPSEYFELECLPTGSGSSGWQADGNSRLRIEILDTVEATEGPTRTVTRRISSPSHILDVGRGKFYRTAAGRDGAGRGLAEGTIAEGDLGETLIALGEIPPQGGLGFECVATADTATAADYVAGNFPMNQQKNAAGKRVTADSTVNKGSLWAIVEGGDLDGTGGGQTLPLVTRADFLLEDDEYFWWACYPSVGTQKNQYRAWPSPRTRFRIVDHTLAVRFLQPEYTFEEGQSGAVLQALATSTASTELGKTIQDRVTARVIGRDGTTLLEGGKIFHGALVNQDYTLSSSSVDFARSAAPVDLGVTLVDDDVCEPPETFTVSLAEPTAANKRWNNSNAIYAALGGGPTTAKVTIIDDGDPLPAPQEVHAELDGSTLSMSWLRSTADCAHFGVEMEYKLSTASSWTPGIKRGLLWDHDNDGSFADSEPLSSAYNVHFQTAPAAGAVYDVRVRWHNDNGAGAWGQTNTATAEWTSLEVADAGGTSYAMDGGDGGSGFVSGSANAYAVHVPPGLRNVQLTLDWTVEPSSAATVAATAHAFTFGSRARVTGSSGVTFTKNTAATIPLSTIGSGTDVELTWTATFTGGETRTERARLIVLRNYEWESANNYLKGLAMSAGGNMGGSWPSWSDPRGSAWNVAWTTPRTLGNRVLPQWSAYSGPWDAPFTGLEQSTGQSITLKPAFDDEVYEYTASVPNHMALVTLHPITDDANATVTVNGNSPSTPVSLSVGENVITVVVTAENGYQRTYTVTVTRAAPNNAPTVSGDIAAVSDLQAGNSRNVHLSGVFNDADGDSLSIDATTSDGTIATVSVADDQSMLTVSGKARGNAIITVTADDGKGGVVSDLFTVTVKAAPTVAWAIADVSELEVDATHEVSLSGVFNDADGDSLTVTANSSNDAIATVAVAADYSGLTLTGKSAGTATITVTAQDSDGNTVSDAFDVTVIKVNNPPTVASAIADATIVNQSGTHQASLSGVFSDADHDSLTITATSSNEQAATVSVSADYATLTVSAQSRGTTNITVTAADGNGGSVEDTFTVTVKAAPVVASAIADVSELEIDATHEVSMSGVFSDADGDALTISATTSDSTVAQVANTIDPSTGSATAITVIGVAAGTATITVTARDSDGNSVSDAFDVTVPAAQQQQAVELPGPVVSLEVIASTANRVTVRWSTPETGGVPDGYIVHLRPENGEKGSGKTKRPKAKKTQVKFNNLQPGQTYQVWARAQNEAGKGERVHATITLPE